MRGYIDSPRGRAGRLHNDLANRVEYWLSVDTPIYMAEAPVFNKEDLPKRGSQKLIDWISLEPDLEAEASETITDGTITCVEIKTSARDFRTGYGLNFVGDLNVLVCPKNVAREIGEDVILSICDFCYVPSGSLGLKRLYGNRWPERRSVATRRRQRETLFSDLAAHYRHNKSQLKGKLLPPLHRWYANQFMNFVRQMEAVDA